jgi:hypothetical protein
VSIWDRLAEVGKEALRKGADALAPAEGESVGTVEGMARAGAAGLARACADEIGKAHCQARTRVSVGHMLRCGKEASRIARGVYYCATCAPEDARPIDVEAR